MQSKEASSPQHYPTIPPDFGSITRYRRETAERKAGRRVLVPFAVACRKRWKARHFKGDPSSSPEVLCAEKAFFIRLFTRFGVLMFKDPRAVLELIAHVELGIVAGLGLPHFPKNFQPALAETPQGCGVALSPCTHLLVVDLRPRRELSTQVAPQMDCVAK